MAPNVFSTSSVRFPALRTLVNLRAADLSLSLFLSLISSPLPHHLVCLSPVSAWVATAPGLSFVSFYV